MTPEIQPPLEPTRRKVRILVAEDSPLNQQVALKQLEKLGYEPEGVSDGTEVMAALQRTPFDIIPPGGQLHVLFQSRSGSTCGLAVTALAES